MDLDRGLLEQALRSLGDVLQARRLSYEVVAVGGSALLILGSSVRPTRDLDVLALVDESGYVGADPLPAPLVEAARDVAATFRLDPDWLNPGPTSLLDLGLPQGFHDRVLTRRFGGLTVHVAGRADQIFFKLYAAADMGPDSKHLADLQRLHPTEEELLAAAAWAISQDPSDGFRTMLIKALEYLGVEDADAKFE
jgi:hypothetical protein